MEPSAPDEKNIIGYKASIQTATDKLVKSFDVTEERARMKAFRNAYLVNNDRTVPNLSYLTIVPTVTCISLMTIGDMPRARKKGSQTSVEFYDYL